MQHRWTRAQFLRRVAGGGAGLAAAGGIAWAADAFLADGSAPAAPSLPAAPAKRLADDGRTRRFYSRPDLKPPTISVVKPAAGTADGYIFLAPSSGPGQRGTMIVDNAGELVWFHRTKGTAMNLRVGRYRGQPVLTWWEGMTEHGLGRGEHVIVDSSYRELARFPAGGGANADLHEFLVTPDDTALISAYRIVTRDLRSLGGRRRGPVVEAVVQELAIPSARVLWEWRSLEHVALEESHQGVGPRFDYFHINSIDIAPDGNLLVSARNTWAVYKVNRRTGRVMWRLGGKKSDFRMGKGSVFAWQHDARAHGDGNTLTIFDNGAAPQVEPQSRGLVLELDLGRMRAALVRKYTHRPGRLVAHFMGSVQVLPDGGVMVGWGAEPYFTEFARGGAIRYDAKLPHGGQNYRALRYPWTGRPSDQPRLAVRRSAGGKTLYASWNGSTELASWQLRTGASATGLADSSQTPARGFETGLAVPANAAYAAAVALDANGKTLATSKTIRV